MSSSLSQASTSQASLSQAPTPSHPLAAYGWDDGWADAFAPYAEQGLLPGRVVRVDRGLCDVVTEHGTLRADTAFVVPRDPMRIVCTGDWVAVDADGDPQFVRTLLPRRTAFVRSTSSQRSEGQVLATNIDHIVICVSLAVELDLGRLERFLALAMSSTEGAALLGDGSRPVEHQAYEAQPLVLLTKADLVPDATTVSHLVEDIERLAPGVQVLPVSSTTGEGVDVFGAIVGGGTSVLLGISGAGKSTLANTLLGEDAMHVQEAREVDDKGRHTTTTRNLLVLPGGGVLIDTPGLRGSVSGTRRPASVRSSRRSRTWPNSAASTTAPTRPSPAAPCSEPSRTGRCPNAVSSATANCSGRTTGSRRRRTPGCAPRPCANGSAGARRAGPPWS